MLRRFPSQGSWPLSRGHPSMSVAMLWWTVLVITIKITSAASAFRYNDDASCKSPISLSVSSYSCAGGSQVCNPGEQAASTGTITLSQDAPDTLCFSSKACLMGMSWMCQSYFNEQIDPCQYLTAESGQSCASAGSYSYDVQFKIPSIDTSGWGTGWWVTVYVDVVDCTGSTGFSSSCNASFKAVSSSSTTSASLVSFASVIAVAVIAWFVRKRRVTAKIDLAQEEERANHFEMMNDQSVRV